MGKQIMFFCRADKDIRGRARGDVVGSISPRSAELEVYHSSIRTL